MPPPPILGTISFPLCFTIRGFSREGVGKGLEGNKGLLRAQCEQRALNISWAQPEGDRKTLLTPEVMLPSLGERGAMAPQALL